MAEMAGWAAVLLRILAAASVLGFGWFALASWREGERRALWVSVAVAAGMGVTLGLASALPPIPRLVVIGLLAAGLVTAVGVILAPIGRGLLGHGQPQRRVDERDIMFARARLSPGTPEYDSYYEMRPSLQHVDDRMRALPGLLSPDAEKAEVMAFAATEAAFDLTEAVREAVDGPVAPVPVERDPLELTAVMKRLARYYGAVDVGVARLAPYHVYSHIGRGTGRWGDAISLEHSWALAFTVEMSHPVVACAPEAPVVMESARQYVEAAKVALILAAGIRRLGFEARAHIDGNYRVIAPLVARDAGLGEIGRMGLLMTPGLGPRVRLGIVTTEMPLVADVPTDDRSVIDFCAMCRKCSESCPTGAIPSGDREPVDEGMRWRINSEACFRYWRVIGTDCARCMSVCPYSHPDSPTHNVVRWAIRRSGGARRALLWMDDLFYGRHPTPRRTGPLGPV